MTKLIFHYKFFINVILAYAVIFPACAQLTISEDQALYFGSLTFISGSTISEVNINPNGTFTSSNIVFISSPTHGRYLLSGGTPSAAYNLSIDSSVNLNGPTSAKHFVLDNITLDRTSSVFNAFGEDVIQVGGRLRTNVTSSLYPNEVYTNTIDITVSY